MASRCFSVLVLLAAAVPSFAQLPAETDRLMDTARLWNAIEYFHPYVAYRDIDWDGALVSALPKIRGAKTVGEYQAAISAMLAELHDPETLLLDQATTLPSYPSAPNQTRVLRNAGSAAFVVSPEQSPTEHIAVHLSGLTVLVRLSEPLTAIPAIRSPKPPSFEPYPSTELRLLAAIKTWGAIHYFFAYKDLMDEDWDDVFAGYLPKFIEAKDATDYNLLFADLLTHCTDTNTAPHSKTLSTYFGEVPAGIRMRLLDKYPIVTAVLDPAAQAAGVHPGEVVKRIGSESITDRFRRFVQYIPASTPQRSGYDTLERLTNGLPGTSVELTIENSQGQAHQVTLTRGSLPITPERTTEPVQVLTGNIGYLDLDRLTEREVPAALDRLKDTRAIIFDLRGPVAPAAAAIARHLTNHADIAAALVTTPIALHPDVTSAGIATQTASTFVVQTVPSPEAPLYKGKTVALIDERTIGESEYAALLFEAANKTEFVGEPSAGAESNVAELPVPGGITVTYSTQDVRHGNGGKLQRLGIQPNIPVPTTAKGLQAGKDEPLEAARAHLAPVPPSQTQAD